ncbi:MAG: tRNA pseudouridine(13) synthase TruD [Archangiaceae bacterium]|nr:tRNA pseudouridine(13) synthase TruD [Archangiaceae bacterium]
MNGRFKQPPEDFEVEELPAYAPCGEGEHLFLWVEKRGVSTPDAGKRLTRQLGLTERDISWAGLKDKLAVTRQFFSVPAKNAEARVPTFEDPDVKVLFAKRHKNKLKNGHLHGNRFTLRVVEVGDPQRLQAAFDAVVKNGLPNFFGEQRFGAAGGNAAAGKKLLESGRRGGNRFERKLMLSAYQSLLFNRALERRIAAGAFARAVVGDVLKKHETGGEFVCADAAVDQVRVDAFEVSPTGPLFGPKMRAAEGEVGAGEAKLLEEEKIGLELFDAGGGETLGARRLFRVRLGEPVLEIAGDVARLSFSLPAGSYATVVLEQVLA